MTYPPANTVIEPDFLLTSQGFIPELRVYDLNTMQVKTKPLQKLVYKVGGGGGGGRGGEALGLPPLLKGKRYISHFIQQTIK